MEPYFYRNENPDLFIFAHPKILPFPAHPCRFFTLAIFPCLLQIEDKENGETAFVQSSFPNL